MEKAKRQDNSRAADDALCQYPDLVLKDHSRSLWNEEIDCAGAEEDAVNYSQQYKKEVQFVFSRCQHHIHFRDPKTGARLPQAGCKSKKSKHKCKHQFPMTKK